MERLSSGDSRARGVLTANRLVLLAAVPLFLILATVAYITVQFAANQSAAQQWVAHTYQVIASLRAVLGDAQDAETGQRGYLLTLRQDFLAPYRAANQRVNRDLARFRQLTIDNPSEQRRAGTLSALIHDHFESLDRTLVAGSGTAPSPDLVRTLERTKVGMDALRTVIAAGMAEEQVLLQERNRQRADLERYEVGFAVGAAILALGILLAAAAMMVRNNLGLADAERARANEAAILQATVDTVRDGIAYFTAEGLLCAFNANFFRLLDLPDSLAKI